MFVAKKIAERGYRVTLVDFYGFGKTPHPSLPLSLDDYVLSIVNLIRYYEIEKVTLVCHSFGGRVGIKLCAKYGYYVEKLMLVDAAGIKPRRNIFYHIKVFDYKLRKKLKLKTTNSGSEDYKRLSPIMKKTFVNVVNEDLTPLLHRIICPTLIFWGQKDKDTPFYMAKKMNKKIKNSAVIECLNCGHFAYIEMSEVFIETLAIFLSGDSDGVDGDDNYTSDKCNSVTKIACNRSK